MGLQVIDLADVDTSGLVVIELDNPHFAESIPMELGFNWPEDRIKIIQAIKTAVRLNLKISMYSYNEEADKFIHYYYREYACLDYLEEHPDELRATYPWLADRN